jgi:hypothetical protein
LSRKNNIPVRQEFGNGKIIEMQGLMNGRPYYLKTMNINAAKTVSTDIVWGVPYLLSGINMTAAIWDGGGILITHQELFNRVEQKDNPAKLSQHATHVGGTMVTN